MIPHATFVDELDLKLKGSGTHYVPFLDGPIVEVDELADNHDTQVFYPHEFDLIHHNKPKWKSNNKESCG